MLFIKSIIFLILLNLCVHAGSVSYPSFIEAQMKIVEQMNEDNATQESIEGLLQEQNSLYERAVNSIMANKDKYIKNIELYKNEIFSLKKVISINKRAGNTFAVYRDKVATKIYLLLRSQNRMLKEILLALDAESIEKYETQMLSLIHI